MLFISILDNKCRSTQNTTPEQYGSSSFSQTAPTVLEEYSRTLTSEQLNWPETCFKRNLSKFSRVKVNQVNNEWKMWIVLLTWRKNFLQVATLLATDRTVWGLGTCRSESQNLSASPLCSWKGNWFKDLLSSLYGPLWTKQRPHCGRRR